MQQPDRGEDALHLFVADEVALERRPRQRLSAERKARQIASPQTDQRRRAERGRGPPPRRRGWSSAAPRSSPIGTISASCGLQTSAPKQTCLRE